MDCIRDALQVSVACLVAVHVQVVSGGNGEGKGASCMAAWKCAVYTEMWVV